MSAIAVATAPRGGRARLRWEPVVLAAVCVLAAAGFVLTRLDKVIPFPQFTGACQRLRGSGLAIISADWFCRPLPGTLRGAYSGALLLVAAGLVLPAAILAATGRRLTAIVPLLVAPAVTFQSALIYDRWWAGTWRDDGWTVHVVTALLLLAPVIAVMLLVRRRDRATRRSVPLLACAAAWLALAAPIAGIAKVAHDMSLRHDEVLGGTLGPTGLVASTAVVIGLFGALLGPDRRWWPWSLVPVAFLLSAGPSLLLMQQGPNRWTDWSRFGAVVPLFAVGLVASAWRPLAERIGARIRPDDATTQGVAERPAEWTPRAVVDPTRVRPTVVLNALGAGLLIVSLVLFRADPLPAQIGVALPTFVGARASISDLRTRQLLRQALTDMDTFRSEEGSYRGFDDVVAGEIDPVLTWRTGAADPVPDGSHVLTMGIATATSTTARIVAVSPSGNAFCIQRDASGVSYGSGSGPGRSNGATSERSIDRALAACGSTPWSSAALRPFPIASMCDGLDPESGYLICRMVQVVMLQTLQRTGPA